MEGAFAGCSRNSTNSHMLGVGGNLGISWGWGVFGGGGLALLSVHDADHRRSAPDKEMQIRRQIIGADQR